MFLSSPGGTEMFQFPPFAPSVDGDKSSTCRVAPFGHLRIISCLPIPAVFRSLPRPSSPPDSLGILHSPFSSFSRESSSSVRLLISPRRLFVSRFAYMKLQSLISQLEKTLEFLKLQTDFLYLSLPLILSQCCQ